MAAGTAEPRSGSSPSSRACAPPASSGPAPKPKSGVRPSYYLNFDNEFPDEKRIDQVIAWLKLPPEQRPHFITLYYSELDHAGHDSAPTAPKPAPPCIKSTAHRQAQAPTRRTPPAHRSHRRLRSRHGEVQGAWIDLDKYADLTNFNTDGPISTPKDPQKPKPPPKRPTTSSRKPTAASSSTAVKVPAALHFNQNPREGDPVIIPTGPYLIRAHAPKRSASNRPPPGRQPRLRSRDDEDYARHLLRQRPRHSSRLNLKPFENVNVYPLLAQILGLDAPKVDGSFNVLSGRLLESANPAP